MSGSWRCVLFVCALVYFIQQASTEKRKKISLLGFSILQEKILICAFDLHIIENRTYCHCLWTVAPTNFNCMCVCVCVSVCLSRFYGLYLTWILIRFGENVGTLVRLNVLKFHKNRFSVEVIMTSLLFFKVISKADG